MRDLEEVRFSYYLKRAMDFADALVYLKHGESIRRAAWSPTMRIVLQPGYPSGINCNKQTAETWNIPEGSLFKCNPYLQIRNEDGTYSMYAPSADDILAEDWKLADFEYSE